MGWGSGTELFDNVVDKALELFDVPPDDHLIQEVVDAMYEAFVCSDWDNEGDSKYWFPYLLETLHNRGDVDDEDYAFYYQDIVN